MKLAISPFKRDRTLVDRVSLVVVVLMAVASAAGLALGSAGLYGPDPGLALDVTEAGLLVSGLLGQDALNLLVGALLLLGST